jgi:two-component system chemotaxis response regulator CheB
MPEKRKKLLVVDDEPSILDLLKNYLSMDRDIYETITATSAREAFQIISESDISLVVSDINMPGVSGLDLLAKVRSHYPEIKVFLITGYGTPELLKEARKGGCLHFIEKPLDFEELRELINREITKDRQSGFEGTLKNIQLVDLLQMCCLTTISTGIRVKKDQREGMIYIEEGEIVHSVCEDKTGEEAFYEILSWKSGSFETLGAVGVSGKTIGKNWQYLIMEALRRVDEKADEMAKVSPESVGKQTEPEKIIRVLIVDDSAMMCKIMKDIFSADESIEVTGAAGNGEDALKTIKTHRPDVITLDVNMPVMDGGTALKHIMITDPLPVVIVSSIREETVSNVFDFLCNGAVDFVSKPVKDRDPAQQKQEMIESVKRASRAKVQNFKRMRVPRPVAKKQNHKAGEKNPPRNLVVIQSGSGGYAELIRTVVALPENLDGCVVVFHCLPLKMNKPLADYLDQRSLFSVRPAKEGSPIQTGVCYIAHPEQRFSLEPVGFSGEPEALSRKKETGQPGENFDSFLISVAREAEEKVHVVLLSGACLKNTEGLREIRRAGGKIIGQTPDTCMLSETIEMVEEKGLFDDMKRSENILETILKSQSGK